MLCLGANLWSRRKEVGKNGCNVLDVDWMVDCFLGIGGGDLCQARHTGRKGNEERKGEESIKVSSLAIWTWVFFALYIVAIFYRAYKKKKGGNG